MFDRLVELLISCAELFKFWFVMDQFDRGVLLRLGKFVKVMQPGLHFIWPLGIDKVLHETVVPVTHSMGHESIVTKDGKSWGFHAVITYKVDDIERAMLDVADSDHGIRDACLGEIGRVLHGSTDDEIKSDDILDKLTDACAKRARKFGIKVISVQLASLIPVRGLRLMGNISQ